MILLSHQEKEMSPRVATASSCKRQHGHAHAPAAMTVLRWFIQEHPVHPQDGGGYKLWPEGNPTQGVSEAN